MCMIVMFLCMLILSNVFLLLIFVDCQAPFVYSACGAPCEKQCALQGHEDLCLGVKECAPGCYCPQVNIELAKSILYYIELIKVFVLP